MLIEGVLVCGVKMAIEHEDSGAVVLRTDDRAWVDAACELVGIGPWSGD